MHVQHVFVHHQDFLTLVIDVMMMDLWSFVIKQLEMYSSVLGVSQSIICVEIYLLIMH